MGSNNNKLTQAQKEQQLNQLKNWVKKLLPDDWDKVDVEAEYDPQISYKENKANIREKIKPIVDTDMSDEAEREKALQEKQQEEEKQKAEQEVEEYNKNLDYRDNKKISEFYTKIDRAITKMVQGYSDLAFIKGRGGIGKSYQIRKALTQHDADYIEIAGEVSEAFLYRLIYENNGKIIWFKDVVRLLGGVKSINLLKSATETEQQRILTKSNYSKKQEDLPDKFLCRCKFIFDYNQVTGSNLREDFEALVSRGDYIEMCLSEDDIIDIMRNRCETDWQREVTEFIAQNYGSGPAKLNLRTQWKAFNTYKFAIDNGRDWKEELKEELQNVTQTRALLYSIMGRKAMRTSELKKRLLVEGHINSMRTADRKINEWLFLEELYKVSSEDKNFYVCIDNIRVNQKGEEVQ